MSLTAYVNKRLIDLLQEKRVIVWYDAEQAFGDVAASFAAPGVALGGVQRWGQGFQIAEPVGQTELMIGGRVSPNFQRRMSQTGWRGRPEFTKEKSPWGASAGSHRAAEVPTSRRCPEEGGCGPAER